MTRWWGVALACAALASAPAMAGTVPERDGLNALVWKQTSAEYRAVTMGAFAAARAALETALADPDWTAALEQSGPVRDLPPAVILDLDDTILDTGPYQAWLITTGRSYSAESFSDWVEERGVDPVPGARDYLAFLERHGITPFFVSNRAARLEEATRDALTALGVKLPADVDTVLLKREHREWGVLKGSRRAVVAGRYRVLQIVGDSLGDFFDDFGVNPAQRAHAADSEARYWGTRWVMLPNPVYGSWENAAAEYNIKLDEDGRRIEKLRALSPWK